MDNCSIHKSDELEALITAPGVTLIYLPPILRIFHPLRTVGPKLKVLFGQGQQEPILICSKP